MAVASLGLERLFVKDESLNPTNSFKARGLSAAVTRASYLGARTLSVPSAGNAANAMAAYAAAAGLDAKVFMPRDVKVPFIRECELYGAEVQLVQTADRVERVQQPTDAGHDLHLTRSPRGIQVGLDEDDDEVSGRRERRAAIMKRRRRGIVFRRQLGTLDPNGAGQRVDAWTAFGDRRFELGRTRAAQTRERKHDRVDRAALS